VPNWPHLRNPPIIEGLLDIRVEPRPDLDVSSLAVLPDSLRSRYPQRTRRYQVHGNIQLDGAIGTAHVDQSTEADGFMFRSGDGTQVYLARRGGFSFSRLHPYTSWDDVRAEARALWAAYCAIAQPVRVTRLALRFINRLHLPLPLGDFREFVLTRPEVAPGLPQAISGLLMRIVVPLPDLQCNAIITETVEDPVEGKLPFILDIDVIVEENVSPIGSEVWQAFERLREAKNLVFFANITDRTKGLYA
jgi:uncharacterized protein (TIGR04255 family)